MKKVKGLLLLVFGLFLTFVVVGCGKSDVKTYVEEPIIEEVVETKSTANTVQLEVAEDPQIFELAVYSGFDSTYEDWLDWIMAERIVLAVVDNKLMWKYNLEPEIYYRPLLDLDVITDAAAEKVNASTNSIEAIEKTTSENNVDTYTITYSNGSTSIFTVTNGKDGKDGVDGRDGIDGVNGKDGKDGKDGLSAFEIYIKYHPEFTGTEEDWINSFSQKPIVEEYVDEGTPGLVYQSVAGLGYAITGYEGNDTEVVIPDEYHGEPVYAIFASAFANKNITKLTIGANVTTIKNNVLDTLKKLEVLVFNGSTSAWNNINKTNNDFSKFTINTLDGKIDAIATPKPYIFVDDTTIQFGRYPQTLETSAITTTALNNIAENAKTNYNVTSWTNYKFFAYGGVYNYAMYKDVDLNNDGLYDYRGVKLNAYRPNQITGSMTAKDSNQDDNGFATATTYWFKYDPIEWQLINETAETYTLLANLALDSQEFNNNNTTKKYTRSNEMIGYTNNYSLSTIRYWLNNTFYQTAFNDLEKELINLVESDNRSFAEDGQESEYSAGTSVDRVFLLSADEAFALSSSQRIAKASDYTKAMGVSLYPNNSCWWMLRTAAENPLFVRGVNSTGIMYDSEEYTTNCAVICTCFGIRPTVVIYK